MDKRLKLKVLIVLLVAGMIFASGCVRQPGSNMNNLTIESSKQQERLTDEKWREMLKTNPPAAPAWTASFMGMGE